MEPRTFRAILLLLYGAALRVSEALSLNLADVDLEEAVIAIRDTKFYKTRLAPLGSDPNDVMTKYSPVGASAAERGANQGRQRTDR
jgi:integrase/recombinase XerD